MEKNIKYYLTFFSKNTIFYSNNGEKYQMPSKIDKFLRNHPVFTRKSFELAMKKDGDINPNTLKNMLAQHIQHGHLIRIKRGLFASIPRGADPENYPINPFLIAASLADDAVIAYHSALSLHGVAYSIDYRLLYLTQQKPKAFKFRNENYQPTLFPTSLINQDKTHCYVNEMDVQGMNIKVTSKERTLVDVLDRPLLGGGWEEIYRSLDMFDHLKLEDIIHYALMLENATTIAKVGFYLEQRKTELKVNQKQLTKLHKHRPISAHYIDDITRNKFQYIKYWNLMVPISLLNRDWEEDLKWESKL